MRRCIIWLWLFAAGQVTAAAAQEREWLLDAAEDDAFLVFGVPETDDVGVSLWCKIGSNKVKLFFPDGSPTLKPDAKADFHIIVAGKDYTLQGNTSANDVTGTTSIETEVAVDDALLTDMESADRFAATIAGHTLTFPLLEAGIANLLRLCKAK